MSRHSLLALCVLLFGAIASGGASAQSAQDDKWDKPIDLKPFVPRVLPPLPPNSQLNPGTVGGTEVPYTTAPLQNSTQSPTQPAPGIRFSIPSR